MESPSILVIDGDPKNLQILRESLESANFRVTTTGNGSEAWNMVQSTRPDIIVSEVDIPGISGFDFLERLQKDPVGSAIPLVFLTNRRNLEDRVKSLRTGVKDYMIKPLHVKEVIARLQMILRRLDRFKGEEYDTPRKIIGRLEEHSVEHLVQNYGVERRTGVLTVYDSQNHNGEIYFRNGSVVNARLGNFRAEKAVYQMLPWDEGHFIMTLKDINVDDEITVSNLGLLLQGFRHFQERGELQKQLPPQETVLVKTAIFGQILKRKSVAGDVLKFISLFDGTRTLSQIIAESNYDDLKTLERTVKLYQQGFVEPVGGRTDVEPTHVVAKKPEPPPEKMAEPETKMELEETPVAQDTDAEISLQSEETSALLETSPAIDPPFPEVAKPQIEDNGAQTAQSPEPMSAMPPESEETPSIAVPEAPSHAEVLEPPFSLGPDGSDQMPDPQQIEKPVPDTTSSEVALPDEADNRETMPDVEVKQPVSQDIGAVCDSLLNGQTKGVAHLAVIGGSNDFRKELMLKLTSGRATTKHLGGKHDDQIELGKILTPNQRSIEVLGIPTESKFLQMLHQIAASLIGYIVLVPSDDSASLGYFGYLINSLREEFIKPHVVAVYTPAGSKRIPLAFVRYTLKLNENEQIVDLNVADPDSLMNLLKQLEAPMYLKNSAPEPESAQGQPV